MRSFLLSLAILTGLVLPAAAETSIFDLKNSMVQFALRQISTPDFTITAEGVEEPEDGSTSLVGVAIADADGVWFEAESLSLVWDASRILSGEIVIQRLAGTGITVHRAPLPTETEVLEDADIAEDDGEPFDWPRSPLPTLIEEMALERVNIASGVVAEQSLAFNATGAVLDEGDRQQLIFKLARTDAVEGQIDLAYRRQFEANTLEMKLTANEGAGGLVAELLGLPDDSGSSTEIIAQGPLTEWSLRLKAEADRVLSVTGSATTDLTGAISLTADIEAVPGEAIGEDLRAVLAPQATLALTVREDDQGVIAIERGSISSPALSLSAEGSFVRESEALDLTVLLDGRSDLARLAPGVEFSRFGFDGKVGGTLSQLDASGGIVLEGLRTDAVDLAEARLDARVGIDGPRISLNISGGTQGLRLDRITPELIGPADLRVEGVWDGDAEVMSLDALALDSRLLSLGARGRVDVANDTASLDYRLSAPELAPIAGAYDVDAGGAFEMSGSLSGALSAPRLSGELLLDGLVYEGTSHGRVRIEHDALFDAEPDGRVALTATGSPFGPADISTRFRLGAEVLSLTEMTASALGAEIRGQIDHRLEEGLTRGQVTLDIADLGTLEPVVGQPLRGEIGGRVDLAVVNARQQVALDLQATDLGAANARLASARISGTVADALGAAAAEITLDARDARFDEARLGTLSARIDATRLATEPRVRLSMTARDVSGYDAGVETLTLTAETPDANTLPTLVARIVGENVTIPGGRMARVEADIDGTELLGPAPATEVRLGIDDFSAGDNGAERVDGTITASDLRAAVPVVDAQITATGLGGGGVRTERTDLTATVRPDGDRATVALTVDTRRIGGAGFTLARSLLEAKITDAFGTPVVDAGLTATSLEAEGLALPRTRLTVRGPLSALDTRLDSAGTAPDGTELALSMAARIDAEGAPQRATVSRLGLDYGEERVELAAPLRITIDGGAVGLRGLDLTLPGGRLSGDARYAPSGIAAQMRLAMADLGILNRLADVPVQSGSLDLVADIDTGRGRGTIDLDLRDFAPDADVAAIGTLGVALDGRWSGGRAEIDAQITGPYKDPVVARLSVPLRGAPIPQPVQGGRLEGSVKWAGRLGDLWALVPAADHVLDGDLDLDVAISGTVANPDLAGNIRLTDGRYENLELGTILTDLTVTSQATSAGTLQLEAEASDAGQGRVTARAELDPERIDASITSNAAVLMRRDDVTAAISLDVKAAGPLEALAVTGDILIDRAEIRLVNATPPSVVTLGDVRIKGEPRPEPEEPGGSSVTLDMTVRAPRDIFVRGRGLDSEWMIDLAVRGTAAAPRVTGAIERIRGQLDLIGTRFDLDRGRVVFNGGRVIDPRLDVRLAAERDDVTGFINVTGFASNPQISFSSSPGLPEEEVLPRTLFGKSRQSLSAGQAISLASGLATLLDGSGGTVDKVRGAIGLDQLGIDPNADGATVTVGKNIGDSVFVGARQSTDGTESAVTVEIEVFEGVTVEGEVGAEGDSALGLKWKKDF